MSLRGVLPAAALCSEDRQIPGKDIRFYRDYFADSRIQHAGIRLILEELATSVPKGREARLQDFLNLRFVPPSMQQNDNHRLPSSRVVCDSTTYAFGPCVDRGCG